MDNSEAITVLRDLMIHFKRVRDQKFLEALELAIRALQDQEGRPANG